jgi:hypothetical protein
VLGSIYEADYVTVPAVTEKAQKYINLMRSKRVLRSLKRK